MQIIIDTKTDSPEQLRKVARLLQELVGDAQEQPIHTLHQAHVTSAMQPVQQTSAPRAEPEMFDLFAAAKEQLKEAPPAKTPPKKIVDDDDEGIDVQIVPY